MKKQLLVMNKAVAIAFILAGYSANAQNITNPDFETYSTCPSGQTQITRATGWTRPTGGTPDYFNSCGYNIATTINANSGTGFVGGYMEITYSPSGLTNYKEYITNHLSAPLSAGVTYTFSFYTAHIYGTSPSAMLPAAITYTELPLAEQGYIGVVFSTTSPATSNTQGGSSSFGATSIVDTFGSGRVLIPASNISVYGSTSRNSWVMVTMNYTAVGGEEYMTIGQFKPGVSSLPDGQAAYYLFDNFVSPHVLPVTFQSFTANRQGRTALLKWLTATEQNNTGFELQRSTDGINWSVIDRIPSKAPGGNSSSQLSYYFTDASPLKGINLYRLKQSDKDGKEQYSAIQSLSFEYAPTINIYPNPVQTILYINGLKDSNTIKLVSIYGQAIKTWTAIDATTQVDLSPFPDGVYMLQIVDKDGNTNIQKIIKK